MKKIKKVIYYQVEDTDRFIEKWLANILNEHGLNCMKLARLLHVSKQTPINWLTGKAKVPYTTIVAICYLLKIKDNPDEVYQKMVDEEKGE